MKRAIIKKVDINLQEFITKVDSNAAISIKWKPNKYRISEIHQHGILRSSSSKQETGNTSTLSIFQL